MPTHYTGLPFALNAERVIETHANMVLLSGNRAYKLKRPVKYPFLDYSTLEKRTHFLLEELRLNRRFSPDIYLGIAEVRARGGKLFIGPTQTGERGVAGAPGGPARGDTGRDEGELVDYCVVMKRIPDDAWLPQLMKEGCLPGDGIHKLVEHLINVYAKQHSDAEIAKAGLPGNLRSNTVANVAEIKRFVPQCLPAARWARLDALLRGWFENNGDVFRDRVKQGRIHDGHGDLKPGNIAFIDGKPVITDCIEFNTTFRELDLLAEFGFLATGLQAVGDFSDAADVFATYRKLGRDDFPNALRRYYQAHLACVMGKVTALRLASTDAKAQTGITALAAHYFALADFYAREPHVVVVAGIMGSGKSTLAAQIALQLGWNHVSSDVTRKQLAGIAPTERLPASAYTREAASKVYEAMNARIVADVPGVVLDGQFPARFMREEVVKAARMVGGTATLVLCDAPDDVVRERMNRREKDPARVSDATADLLAKARADFELVGDEGFDLVIRHDTRAPAVEAAAGVIAKLIGPEFQPALVI
ncbi:MAG: AAA family ATPase [Planctomycetes bacterium]|nr:AAA family ATPase [Planctomycetota bacterium]